MKYKILAVLVTLAVGFSLGYYASGNSDSLITAIATPTTSVFNSAKIAITGFAPADGTATTSQTLINTDSTDRVITSAVAYCSDVGNSLTYLTGAGLASLTFTLGTTTTAANSRPNVNSFVLTIATSTSGTTYSYAPASTTDPVPNQVGRLWASGTTLLINSNATNTADCIVGVHYLPS